MACSRNLVFNFVDFPYCGRYIAGFSVYLYDYIGLKMKINELTKFAITLGLLPWIPAYILHLKMHGTLAVVLIAVFVTLSLSCFVSKTFAGILKNSADKTGHFIGKYSAIVVLAFVYIFAVLPTGFLMKIVKRDRLRLKKPDVESYWTDYDKEKTDYEYQF